MGMDPRVYASASFYAGILSDEESEILNNELDEAGFLVATEGDDFGVEGNYATGYVTVLTFLTSSWGEGLDIDEFKEEYDKFVNEVTDFCVNKKKCKLPSFKIGATYW